LRGLVPDRPLILLFLSSILLLQVPIGRIDHTKSVRASNCGRIEGETFAHARQLTSDAANVVKLFTASSESAMESFAASKGAQGVSGSFTQGRSSSSATEVQVRATPGFACCIPSYPQE
jgi:hypothetical protein